MEAPRPMDVDISAVLMNLLILRDWCTEKKVDPWAFRHALLNMLEADTADALFSGIPRDRLKAFDVETVESSREMIDMLLKKRGEGSYIR